MELIHTAWTGLLEFLRAGNPLGLILAMAFLPLAGVPASPLVVLSGARFGPLWGFVAAAGGLAFNMATGYWIAAHGFRPSIQRWLKRRNRSIPALHELSDWQLILLCRITPGVPLVLQNYTLGYARVRFPLYLAISLPIQWAYAFAFAVFGDSIMHSNVWRIAIGTSVLVAVLLLISLLRKWAARRFARLQSARVLNPTSASEP